jgi:uncharacterized protein (TIGR03086 family)
MNFRVGSGHHGMTVPDLEPAARRLAALLDRVPDSALDAPTPCADLPVAGLLDHLLGLADAFRAAAAKEPYPDGATPSAGHLDPQWRSLLPTRLDALVAAWRDPAAGEGVASAGGVEMPALEMAVVALDELVLHGWDRARALGKPYEVDGDDAAAVLGFTSAFGSAEGTPGLFGPAVPVPEDAPPFERALGFSGRDPAWSA